MRLDSLQQYISLREQLTREKSELEQRLQLINQALGAGEAAVVALPAAAARPAGGRTAGATAGPRRGRPPESGLSLREAVLKVLSSGAKSKEDVLAGVQALGYRFTTKDPLNSLGVILYGRNPKFNRENGLFSLPSGVSGSGAGGGSGSSSKGRRTMSPEARARIAAAQRARWAKARGGK